MQRLKSWIGKLNIKQLAFGNTSKALIVSVLLFLALCFVIILFGINSVSRKRVNSLKQLTTTEVTATSEVQNEAVVVEEVQVQTPVATEVVSLDSIEAVGTSVLMAGDVITYTNYIVQEGDSIAEIAKKTNLRPQTLLQINSLKTVYPQVGSQILIPNIDGQIYTIKEGDSFFSLAKNFSLSISWTTFKAINEIKTETLVPGTKVFIPHTDVTFLDSYSQMQTDSEDGFILPIANGNITTSFDQIINDPISGTKIEMDGILIQTLSAADVLSSASGSVVDRGFNPNGTSFVKMSHENGYTTYYNYLTWVNVAVGQKVKYGEIIGTISEGNTKMATPTLFFRIEQDGIALNPTLFF